MPAPQCLINGNPPPVAVAAGATFTIALASTAGANFWSIQATSADETTSAAAVDETLDIDMGDKTSTCVAPASLGTCVIFTSEVGVEGPGLDADRIYQPSFTTTFKVNVLTAGGLAVIALDETFEQSAVAGWIAEQNAVIRAVGGATPPTAVQYITHASTSKQIGVSGPVQAVDADTTGGAFTSPMPTAASCSDGQVVSVKDNANSWGANVYSVSVESGVSVEDPRNPGTFINAGTLALPKVNSAGASWRLYKERLVWGLA